MLKRGTLEDVPLRTEQEGAVDSIQKKSPFCTGSIATGEGFIGREKELIDFSQRLLDGGNLAICGLPRIGKSSLIYHILERKEFAADRNTLIAKIFTLGKYGSFYALWRALVKELCKNLKQKRADAFDAELEGIVNALFQAGESGKYTPFQEGLDDFFRLLKGKGFRSILYIDEFDFVVDRFRAFRDGEEASYYFQEMRDLGTNPDCDVTYVIVSRRSLSFLEERCCGGSVFHLTFDSHHLPGFSDDDLRSMRNKLQNCGVKLEDSEWNSVLDYTGRNPYLLSLICNDLVLDGGKRSTSKVIESCYQRVLDYCKEIVSLLEDEQYMRQMVQIFIGPRYDIIPQQVKELQNRGYIFQSGDGFETIETISKFFLEYLSVLSRNNADLDIFPLLTQAEKTLRLIIEKKMKEKYPISKNPGGWEARIRRDYQTRYRANPTRYKYFVDFEKADAFIQKTRRFYNLSSGITFLNVISIGELSNILEHYWSDFAPVFSGQPFQALQKKLKLLERIRNPLCHSNSDYLTSLELQEGKLYCQELVSINLP